MRRAVALGLLLFTLAACSPHPTPQVWFAPDLGSSDTPDLFVRPDLWSDSRRAIRVFKFYEAEILASTPVDCPKCGPNLWPRLVDVQALPSLKTWGIQVAVEMPVLKAWSCDGEATRALALRALDRVSSSGGHISTVAMDEPFLGGRTCGLPTAETAARTASFIHAVEDRGKDVQVGDIEAFPSLEPAALARWLLTLRLLGVRLSFLHLDIDRVEVRRLGLRLGEQLRPVQVLCEALGIDFGVIVWGQDSSSDTAYFDDARRWYGEMGAIFGVPDHTIFQSWSESSDGRRDVPSNLPESDPSRFTHTRLIRETVGGGVSAPPKSAGRAVVKVGSRPRERLRTLERGSRGEL
jgi:hypothetical protein